MVPLLALAAVISSDCAAADYRAFDFWIGEWTVADTRSGRDVARSRIEAVADGCGIRENYEQSVGPAGKPVHYLGASFSAYDRSGKQWRQFYLDSRGEVTSFSGGYDEGAMILKAGDQRMTIRPEGELVRQIGEVTRDGGISWTPQYDFTYRRSFAHSPTDR